MIMEKDMGLKFLVSDLVFIEVFIGSEGLGFICQYYWNIFVNWECYGVVVVYQFGVFVIQFQVVFVDWVCQYCQQFFIYDVFLSG